MREHLQHVASLGMFIAASGFCVATVTGSLNKHVLNDFVLYLWRSNTSCKMFLYPFKAFTS